MEDPVQVIGQLSLHLRVLVGGVVFQDCMDDFTRWNGTLDGVEELDELLWRCWFMQRPTTVPSSTFKAANSVVVPWRLPSCVMVPHLPSFNGSPG
jgi:hypothetical protein